MHTRSTIGALVATGAAAALLVTSLVAVPGTALALPGDAGSGKYGPAAGTNTFTASVKNTGTTKHLYDYLAVPAGNGVQSCAVVSGFPSGSSCIVDGGGPGTAEIQIGSGGLSPGQTGIFSFVTTSPLCMSGCPTLTGAINSTSSPSNYVPLDFLPTPPCPDITISGGPTLPDGIQGDRYHSTDASSADIQGGKAPYSVTVTDGSLPPGMSLSTNTAPYGTGALDLTGTPTASGTFTYTATVADSTASPPGPCTASKSFTIAVHCGGITIKGPVNPNALGDVGRPIRGVPLEASGGTPPYGWQMVPRGEGRRLSPPPGTHLQPSISTESAALNGTPTAESEFNYIVRVIDSNGCWGETFASVFIAPGVTVKSAKLDGKPAVEVDLDDEDDSNARTLPRAHAGWLAPDAAAAAARTLDANDLRYRKRRIGGHFGDYVVVFRKKRVTTFKMRVAKGRQYCFSAEPHSTKGHGWGREVCKKIRG